MSNDGNKMKNSEDVYIIYGRNILRMGIALISTFPMSWAWEGWIKTIPLPLHPQPTLPTRISYLSCPTSIMSNLRLVSSTSSGNVNMRRSRSYDGEGSWVTTHGEEAMQKTLALCRRGHLWKPPFANRRCSRVRSAWQPNDSQLSGSPDDLSNRQAIASQPASQPPLPLAAQACSAFNQADCSWFPEENQMVCRLLCHDAFFKILKLQKST